MNRLETVVQRKLPEIKQGLKKAEKRTPLQEDRFRHGASRGELRSRGIAFVNHIGDGEKPIIDGTIDGVDLGSKLFLSEQELALCLEHSHRETSPLFSKGLTLETITDHMTDLLFGLALARSEYQNIIRATKDSISANRKSFGRIHVSEPSKFQQLLRRLPLPVFVPTEEAIRKGIGRFQNLSQYFQLTSDRFGRIGDMFQLLDESILNQRLIDDGMGRSYRGIDLDVLSEPFRNREFYMQRLSGTHCPFVECGYIFGPNPDFRIPIADNDIRINEVTRHLATHGLSETGGGGDQVYITIPQYVELFMKPEKQTESGPEVSVSAIDRIMETARQKPEKYVELVEIEVDQNLI